MRRCKVPFTDNSGTKINGVPLSDMGLALAGAIDTGAPAASTSLVNVPGFDGSLDMTLRDVAGRSYFDRRDVTVPLVASGTRDDVFAMKAAMGAYNGRQVDLYDARYGGCWRGTLTLDKWTDYHESWGGTFYSTVDAKINAEPTLVMRRETARITSGASVRVLGNHPTWPTFTLTPTGSSRSIGVSVSLPDGTLIGSVTHTSAANITSTVTVDCLMSTMSAGGSTLAVSIDDDYPYLVPKSVVVTLTGCSGAVMTYEPRVML